MKGWNHIVNTGRRGFTIVELLIVIVVIAVLAAILIVGYGAVQNNAHDASVKADLQKIDDAFKQYALDNGGTFPISVDSIAGLGIKLSPDSYYTTDKANIYLCSNTSASEYAVISKSRSSKRFVVRSETGITEYTGSVVWDSTTTNSTTTCADIDSTYSPNNVVGIGDGRWLGWTGTGKVTCDTGYILVPGNTTFGTADFCIMKYEAKNVGGVATSQAGGSTWVSVTQPAAQSIAAASCTGCRLVSSREWLTIAANVISVPSNWSGGTVGSGTMYTGHSDNSPASAIAASTSDSNGYINTGNASGTQRRTLTLTNGEVIWDFSGNVWEIVSDTIAGGQQPGFSGENTTVWKEWNSPSIIWNGLPSISIPANVYTGAGSWSSTQGIGMFCSNYSSTTTAGILRGSSWMDTGGYAGVLGLFLCGTPSDSYPNVGFRVAK